MLNHDGHRGLSYSLWSLAVEEYGKALFFSEKKNGEIKKSIFRDHKEKFEKGFGKIKDIIGSTFREIVTVTQNASANVVIVSYSGKVIFIGAGVTGEFEDTTNGSLEALQLDPDLRFRFLYVGWDESKREWVTPEPKHETRGMKAYQTISKNDLEKAINSLKSIINKDQI